MDYGEDRDCGVSRLFFAAKSAKKPTLLERIPRQFYAWPSSPSPRQTFASASAAGFGLPWKSMMLAFVGIGKVSCDPHSSTPPHRGKPPLARSHGQRQRLCLMSLAPGDVLFQVSGLPPMELDH